MGTIEGVAERNCRRSTLVRATPTYREIRRRGLRRPVDQVKRLGHDRVTVFPGYQEHPCPVLVAVGCSLHPHLVALLVHRLDINVESLCQCIRFDGSRDTDMQPVDTRAPRSIGRRHSLSLSGYMSPNHDHHTEPATEAFLGDDIRVCWSALQCLTASYLCSSLWHCAPVP